MLTGRRFGAEDALRIGLLNRVVERDQLLAEASDLAEEITANSECGVLTTKLGLWPNLDAPSLRHAMRLENRTQVRGQHHRQDGRGGAGVPGEAGSRVAPDVAQASSAPTWRRCSSEALPARPAVVNGSERHPHEQTATKRPGTGFS